MRRKPTYAMYLADEKRIAKARALYDAAFTAALVGCPHDMGCGTWIDGHATLELRSAFYAARETLQKAEQAAVDRGTMYRNGSLLFRVAW